VSSRPRATILSSHISARSSSFALVAGDGVSIRIWAIRCKECKCWFFLCRGCYHGQCYCCDHCRHVARRRQCAAAQAQYLNKLKGRKRRAAATAAYRARDPIGVHPEDPVARSNRSTYPPGNAFAGDRLPEEACCAHCGRRGPVRQWH